MSDPQQSDNTVFITARELAKLLRISSAQVYIMANKKEIPFIRVTEKRIVFNLHEVLKWMETRTVRI